MIKGKLNNGFDYEINEDVFDNIRFFEMLAEVEENPLILAKMLMFLFGREQKEALYKHLEQINGKASVTDVMNCVEEIFEANNAAKN